jgi:hypothetical protein
MRSKTVSIVVMAIAVVLTLGLTSHTARAALIYGQLSNFDVHQFVDMEGVNDFELILWGEGLTCDDISDFYNGWGIYYPGCQLCEDLGDGRIMIRWYDPDNPIPFCTYVHFGVRFYPGSPDVFVESATWTIDGVPVGGIDLIWQTWVGTAECPVGDIIWYPMGTPKATGPEPPFTVERKWAYVPEPIPLDSLTQGNSMLEGLDWSVPEIEIMDGTPGQNYEIWTPPLPQEGAVIFTYTVSGGRQIEMVFINEAELQPPSDIPTLSEWAMIIFAVVIMALMTYVVVRRRRCVQPTPL